MPVSISAMRAEVKNQIKEFCKADVVPHLLFKCMEQEKNVHDGSTGNSNLVIWFQGLCLALPQIEICFNFATFKRPTWSLVSLVESSVTNINM